MLTFFQQETKGVSFASIHNIFCVSSSTTSHEIISRTHNTATAVYNESYSFRSLINCWIPGVFTDPEISSVKLEILSDDSSQLIVLRRLSGDCLKASMLIEDFSNRLDAFLNFPQQINYFFSKSFQSESLTLPETLPERPHRPFNSFNIDIHKILATSDRRYQVQLKEFIEGIKGKIDENVFELIDLEIKRLTNDICKNYSDVNVQYCRSILEKSIYPKIYENLLDYFIQKEIKIDIGFVNKREKLSNLCSKELLIYLQVAEKYMLIDSPHPYAEAKVVFSRFNRLKIPVDKLNCLIATVACMKSCVVDYWKGNLEIQAMDDELPILMYLLLTSNLTNPHAELKILSLYVSDSLENESRIITNFSSATYYISCHLE